MLDLFSGTALLIGVIVMVIALIVLCGLRIIPQTHRGIVERFGRRLRFCQPGLTWIIPLVDNMRKVNVTQQMVDAEPQEIITKENLNAGVDAQVWFKVKDTEEDVCASQYNVDNYRYQVVQLARTTLRSIIGELYFKEANGERAKINDRLQQELQGQCSAWGIEILNTELKQLDPPPDVQTQMNEQINAEIRKMAAVDDATATETKADGEKRAEIKKAQGESEAIELKAEAKKNAKVLNAEGTAKAIDLEMTALKKHFSDPAVQLYKKLETTEAALRNNSKIVLTQDGVSPTLVLNDTDDTVIPAPKKATA